MTSNFIPFQAQTILSLLGEVEAIHIIASIDHINAPLSEYHVLVIHYAYNKLITCCYSMISYGVLVNISQETQYIFCIQRALLFIRFLEHIQ